MNAAQVSFFATQSAKVRESIWGLSCEYKGHSFTATASSSRDARQLRDGGFQLEMDRTIRFRSASLPVEVVPHSPMKVAGVSYKVATVAKVHASNDVVVGLISAV